MRSEVHKSQVLKSLTLSRTSSYSTNMTCFTLFYLPVVYCALCVGYSWMMVIGCMVVSFYILFLCSCITFMTRCAMRS
jgi:hypothetical protein